MRIRLRRSTRLPTLLVLVQHQHTFRPAPFRSTRSAAIEQNQQKWRRHEIRLSGVACVSCTHALEIQSVCRTPHSRRTLHLECTKWHGSGTVRHERMRTLRRQHFSSAIGPIAPRRFHGQNRRKAGKQIGLAFALLPQIPQARDCRAFASDDN